MKYDQTLPVARLLVVVIQFEVYFVNRRVAGPVDLNRIVFESPVVGVVGRRGGQRNRLIARYGGRSVFGHAGEFDRIGIAPRRLYLDRGRRYGS